MKRVYYFPNGFSVQASSMYGLLRNYNLNPAWGEWENGGMVINLPDNEVSCLVKMAEHDPARFGNASEVLRLSQTCTHNEMVINPDSVNSGKIWKCALCGYVYTNQGFGKP